MISNIRPIHPFPARMAPELAWNELASTKSLRILDPMSGSGTTLVAAKLRGHEAIGFDRDPLAILIATAWLSSADTKDVAFKAAEVLERAKLKAAKTPLRNAYPFDATTETKQFIRYWFDSTNRRQLSALADTIRRLQNKEIRDLMWCAFSRMIVTKKVGVSLAMDVSHSRPHRVYTKAPVKPFDCFLNSVNYIIKKLPFSKVGELPTRSSVTQADARNLPLEKETIDAVVTSPPYLNAIDYLRGHKLSLVWMGYSTSDICYLRSTNIGTESKAKLVNEEKDIEEVMGSMCEVGKLTSRDSGMLRQYARDLKGISNEIHRVLKYNGRAVFVIGDCNIKDTFVENSKGIQTAAEQSGLTLLETRKRPLPENRRYLPPPTTTSSGSSMQKRMREEVILTFVKAP